MFGTAVVFGTAVGAMVEEVTDNKKASARRAQGRQIVHAPDLSPGAKLIKLADKITNLNSLKSSSSVEWPTERRLAWVEWCQKVVAGLRGANTMLGEQFDEAAEAAGKAHHRAASRPGKVPRCDRNNERMGEGRASDRWFDRQAQWSGAAFGPGVWKALAADLWDKLDTICSVKSKRDNHFL